MILVVTRNYSLGAEVMETAAIFTIRFVRAVSSTEVELVTFQSDRSCTSLRTVNSAVTYQLLPRKLALRLTGC